MRVKTLLIAVILISVARVAQADPPLYVLDLAGGDTTIPIPARQDVQYQVIDKLLPTVRVYTTTQQITIPDVQPLQIPGAGSGGGQPGIQPRSARVPLPGQPVDCPAEAAAVKSDLEAATSEGEIKTKIAVHQSTAPCQEFVNQAIGTLTTDPPQKLNLKSGEVATITVTRSAVGSEKDSKTWTFTFTAGVRGAWLMHYGFSFFGNRDRAFTAVAVPGQQGSYKITPVARRNNLEYLPTFTFSYVPAWVRRQGWGVAATAGIGTDLSNVTALLGGSFIIRDNVNIYVGVAATKQQRLNGKYHNDDTVTENLSADQLNDKVYVPTIVFGVGFRFSSNPFNSGNGGQPAAKPPATPAPGSS